jgi:hypothetical protein
VGRLFLRGRDDVSSRSWTVTVPAPVAKQAPSNVIDMASAQARRPAAHEHDQAAPQARGQLQVASNR